MGKNPDLLRAVGVGLGIGLTLMTGFLIAQAGAKIQAKGLEDYANDWFDYRDVLEAKAAQRMAPMVKRIHQCWDPIAKNVKQYWQKIKPGNPQP